MGRPLKIAKVIDAAPGSAVSKEGAIGNVLAAGSQIQATCNIAFADGNTSNVTASGSILRQLGSKKFLCNVGAALGICKLTTDSALVSGTATGTGLVRITAVDSAAQNYYVSKLGSKKITVVQAAPFGGTHVYANNTSQVWGFGTASGTGDTGNLRILSA